MQTLAKVVLERLCDDVVETGLCKDVATTVSDILLLGQPQSQLSTSFHIMSLDIPWEQPYTKVGFT